MEQKEFANSEEGKKTVQEVEQEEKETPEEDPSTEKKPESPEDAEKQKKVDEALSQEKGLDAEEKKLEEENAERRNRIVQLRAERRTQKDELGENNRSVQPVTVQPVQAQEQTDGYDQRDIDSANYVIDQFVGEHPEYSKENESGDTNWAKLYAESELDENRPKNPFDVKKRLEKAHAYINSQKDPIPQVDPAEEEAKKKSLELAGQGGGSSGTAPTSEDYDNSDVRIFTKMGYKKKDAVEMAKRQKANKS